ncbi:class I SAM-dependent methyltransferase [Bacillus sp. 03113]|uniref:class I SAM-dependent methyltransferase n=1 Tax=Bacillus sp. 03113 TaxID=2578211 RepID=UPI0011434826|nr:class I SAM-dependent methyltransferase [Bacillus sp. 03113]
MSIHSVEELFTLMNETAIIIMGELSCSYLEALGETGENIFEDAILQKEISELSTRKLKNYYQKLNMDKYKQEEIRKAFQLCILKGMQENIQPNHQMTPDSIGMLVGYFVQKYMTGSSIRILDPAIGTGNLLATVINQNENKQISGYGVDIDDLLIKLAYINANLLTHSVELFCQDSLERLFIDPVDAVISDLPVGYYPNDIRAADYILHSKIGHSFAHYLFIEQSISHVKNGGFLFLIIPNGLFEGEQANGLQQYLKEHAVIHGLLQLPLSMFKNKNAAKSLLILQKKGIETKQPKQVLLVDMPSFSNKNEMEKIFVKIDKWFKENY